MSALSKYSRFGAKSVNAAAEPRDSVIFFLLRPASLTHMLFDEGSHFLQEIQSSAFCSLSCEPLVQSPFRISWSDFGEPEQSLLFFRTNYEVTEELRVTPTVQKCEAIQQAEISVRR
jgi:hypothetical protein